jgi:glycosyltransferase involved in cell wall biosynthesis
MHILIALTYYRPHYSGLTIHAEREARALVERGHQVMVLTSRFDPALPAYEVKDGVEVFRPKVWLHISKGVIMPSMPYWAWKLARQADVIHLHAPQLDAAPIAVLARLLGKPVVLTYHCDMLLPAGFIHSIANRVSNLANHITARVANVIVHNTRDYAEHSPFLRHYLNKLQPILPPVEVTAITAADREAFRLKFDIQPGQRLIGMAARLATEKGVEYLAEALPLVLQQFSQARVLFVGPYQNVIGEEDYTQRLAPLIQQLSGHWSFLGVVSPVEMSAFFHECEVTVLPSINSTESYGLVQVESMTCGTPVVASDLPGVREPVQMSGNGLIVPARNSQALAKALIAILERPERYQGNPQTVAELSTPASVAAEYERAFEMAMSKKQATLPHRPGTPQRSQQTANLFNSSARRQDSENSGDMTDQAS